MINIDCKFIYIGVPKTGTTSIENFIKKKFTIISECHSKHCPISLHDSKYLHYFKFSFVRNPWDWIVSWFSMTRLDRIGFKRWLFETVEENEKIKNTNPELKRDLYYRPLYLSQSEYISVDDEIKMDFVGKFENLQKDFDFVCEKLKISNHILEFKNKTFHDHYSLYYDEESLDFVRRKYKKDIENFKYTF